MELKLPVLGIAAILDAWKQAQLPQHQWGRNAVVRPETQEESHSKLSCGRKITWHCTSASRLLDSWWRSLPCCIAFFLSASTLQLPFGLVFVCSGSCFVWRHKHEEDKVSSTYSSAHQFDLPNLEIHTFQNLHLYPCVLEGQQKHHLRQDACLQWRTIDICSLIRSFSKGIRRLAPTNYGATISHAAIQFVHRRL